MSTRYARLRPQMTADEAISYLRRQARDEARDDLRRVRRSMPSSACSAWCRSAICSRPIRRRSSPRSWRPTSSASPTRWIRRRCRALFAEHDLNVIPVVDRRRQDEGHRDRRRHRRRRPGRGHRGRPEVRRYGSPRPAVPAVEPPRDDQEARRAGSTILLVGEMLTATALGFFEDELDHGACSRCSCRSSSRAAATRARRHRRSSSARWRSARSAPRTGGCVMRREILIGLALGAILGAFAAVRVLVWGAAGATATATHFVLIGAHRRAQRHRLRAVGNARRARCCRSCCASSAPTPRARRRRWSRRSSMSAASSSTSRSRSLILRGAALLYGRRRCSPHASITTATRRRSSSGLKELRKQGLTPRGLLFVALDPRGETYIAVPEDLDAVANIKVGDKLSLVAAVRGPLLPLRRGPSPARRQRAVERRSPARRYRQRARGRASRSREWLKGSSAKNVFLGCTPHVPGSWWTIDHLSRGHRPARARLPRLRGHDDRHPRAQDRRRRGCSTSSSRRCAQHGTPDRGLDRGLHVARWATSCSSSAACCSTGSC